MNIKTIRVYQSVKFDGKEQTYFFTEGVNGSSDCEIKYNKELNSMEIKNKKEHILVPMTNISSIYLDSKKIQEQEAHKKEEEKKALELAKNKKDTSRRPR